MTARFAARRVGRWPRRRWGVVDLGSGRLVLSAYRHEYTANYMAATLNQYPRVAKRLERK